jgi:hypothetical protein
MDACVKLAREFKRADKALIKMNRPDSAEHKAAYDRATFLLTVTKPESLPGAGDQIQLAARLVYNSVPDAVWCSLLFIGANLKKSELRLDDMKALREAILLITFVAVVDESAPAQISFADCDLMTASHKEDVLSMLNNALGFMSRPRLA